MYELLRRSSERPWGAFSHELAGVPSADRKIDRHLILHMRENRSHLSQEARLWFSMIALLFMVTSIAPALNGHWLVPAFSVLAMAGLTFALERHAKSQPACETRELDDGCVRHRDGAWHTSSVVIAGTASPTLEIFNPGTGLFVYGSVRFRW